MARTVRIVASLIIACGVAVVVGAPSVAQSTRTLTVTPAVDLVDGDVVALHGTGFTPGATVFFCQAVEDGTQDPEDCGGDIFGVQADAAGEFVADLAVRRFILPSSVGSVVDCAQPSATCAIGSSDFLAPTRGFAFAPITFVPKSPRTLTVIPDTDLDAGDVVTVHGTGFAPSATVSFCQTVNFAAPAAGDCGAPVQSALSDAAGEFTATYTVQRFITVRGSPTDCALPGPACVIGASDIVAGPALPFAPLTFLPQPPPAVTVIPSSGLVDGDVVAVSGISFFPGDVVFVCQGVGQTCYEPSDSAQVDASGSFSVSFAVQRFMTTSGLTRLDCAAPSAGCSLTYGAPGRSGAVPIAFAPQPPLPQISGTVTDATGAPVAGVAVWAYSPSDGWVGSLQAVTDEQGSFEFAQVEPGVDYRILFRPPIGSPLGSEWWDEQPARQLAKVVALSSAEITEVHAQLEEAGSISGSVTDADGNPLPGVLVWAFSPGDTWIGSHTTSTSSDGTYRIDGLRARESGVEYRVLFSPPAGSGLAPEWFDDVAHRSLATAVSVPGAETVAGIDAQLEQPGALSGHVTDAGGNPVAGVRVSAFGPGNTLVASYSTSTAADGTYRIGEVGAGDYHVRFSPPAGSGLAAEWFDDAANRSQAAPVAVSPGQTTAGVGAQLANAS
jgi:protocatechuate 3,4-dioxygenase beta subunit